MNPLIRVCALCLALACSGPGAADILDLQPYRRSAALAAMPADGGGWNAELTDLNPAVGSWYVLKLTREGVTRSYHLENPRPGAQLLRLDPGGVTLVEGGRQMNCALWDRDDALARAQRSALPFAPLCGGRLYLRNPAQGTYTELERVTNFLRDNVWGGDRIVAFVRDQFYRDAYAEHGNLAPAPPARGREAPAPAAMLAAIGGLGAETPDLDLDVDAAASRLQLGQWYPVRGASGVYVSVVQPAAVAGGRDTAPDEVEAAALDYLVAFDLGRFDLAFALGTDHPRLGWSERALDRIRDDKLPGPDGIDSAAPLQRTGMISPAVAGRVQAAFAGGFKREHGAFRYGALALRNGGSHYGFVEEGVVFSRLQPGLATLYVLTDGTIGMKTWSAADQPLLQRLRYARQNGVPLVDYDAATGGSHAGALVARWSEGNWSGSKDEKFRTLRAGACLVPAQGRDFLVYGYFSTATPPAMARVFAAYGCRYAMHLDMNALEHTYLALYTRGDGPLRVQHLVRGMEQVDRKGGAGLAPRFLAFPDDRDFFYLLRKADAP